MTIRHYFTDSGFAFVLMDDPKWDGVVGSLTGLSQSQRDDSGQPVVLVYDLDRLVSFIPGEPEVRGQFLCSYYLDALVAYAAREGEDLRIHGGTRELIVPSSCLREATKFLGPV